MHPNNTNRTVRVHVGSSGKITEVPITNTTTAEEVARAAKLGRGYNLSLANGTYLERGRPVAEILGEGQEDLTAARDPNVG